ncbi:MAG: hypothetical protein ACLQVI_23035 [Polyangiaceae bacterium]
MKPALFAVAPLALVACGGAQPTAASPTTAAPGDVAHAAAPDVDIRNAKSALVGASTVPMDGIAEGLAWPALRDAVNRRPGDHAPLTIAVARDVSVNTVMRAVWTLRDADIRLQTPDAAGTPRVLSIHPRPDSPSGASGTGCHLAVFVESNGDLRVSAPGGPRSVRGPDAPGALARALSAERSECAIRYVAFGADAADAAWGSVFDVAEAVDREKSAGDARYVLGEPVHAAAPAQ